MIGIAKNFQKWEVTQNGGIVFEMGGLNPSTNYDFCALLAHTSM